MHAAHQPASEAVARALPDEPAAPAALAAAAESFDSMNALRGLGALIVVAGHLELRSVVPIGHAWMAVDMFFALSGFVIAHAYDPRFARGLGVYRFMVSRWIRLFPMLLMGALVALLAELAGAREGPRFSAAELAAKSIAQLFTLHFPTARDADVFDLNLPMYTLEYEMLGYLVFALAWSPSRRWLGALSALGAVALICATISEGASGEDAVLRGQCIAPNGTNEGCETGITMTPR